MEFIQAFLLTSKYILGRNGGLDIYYFFSIFVVFFYLWKRHDKALLIARACLPIAIVSAIIAFLHPWADRFGCFIFFIEMVLDITIMMFATCNCKKWKIGRFADAIACIHAVETILALIIPKSSLWITEKMIGGVESVSRLRLFYLDSETMAFVCGLTMAILIYQIIKDGFVWRYVVGLVVMSIDLFLSYGLGGITCALVATIFMVVLIVVNNVRELKIKQIKKVGLVAYIIMILVVAVTALNSTYLDSIKGIAAGIDVILNIKLIKPLTNLENVLGGTHLLGVGFGNGNMSTAIELMNTEMVYTNSFIRIIAEVGAFGIILVGVVTIGLGYYAIKYGGVIDKTLYIYVIIYQLMGGYFTDPILFLIYGWIIGDCLNIKVSREGKCKISLFNHKDKEHLFIAEIGHKRIPSREGGVEIVVEEISKRMVQKGHKVDAYNRSGHHVSGAEFNVVDYDHLTKYEGIHIIRIPTIQEKGLAAFVYSLFASICVVGKDYDVVHYHAEGPCLFMWIPSLFGMRTICTVHGLDWQRTAKWGSIGSRVIKLGEKIAVLFADEIIVLSKHVQQYFLETYGRETNLVPNGVNKPKKKEAELITYKWGLSSQGYLLGLCRITREKKIDLLIESFKKIETDKKLVIAGGSSDSDAYVKELHELAEDDPRIIFTGFVQGEEMEELYSNAYVYVLPSELEGMPLSLLEAMSYGNCCLTSDITENTDVIQDKGMSFKTNNMDDLVRALNELICDTEKVKVFQKEASDYICNKYNWDDVVDRTLSIYRANI